MDGRFGLIERNVPARRIRFHRTDEPLLPPQLFQEREDQNVITRIKIPRLTPTEKSPERNKYSAFLTAKAASSPCLTFSSIASTTVRSVRTWTRQSSGSWRNRSDV